MKRKPALRAKESAVRQDGRWSQVRAEHTERACYRGKFFTCPKWGLEKNTTRYIFEKRKKEAFFWRQ